MDSEVSASELVGISVEEAGGRLIGCTGNSALLALCGGCEMLAGRAQRYVHMYSFYGRGVEKEGHWHKIWCPYFK